MSRAKTKRESTAKPLLNAPLRIIQPRVRNLTGREETVRYYVSPAINGHIEWSGIRLSSEPEDAWTLGYVDIVRPEIMWGTSDEIERDFVRVVQDELIEQGLIAWGETPYRYEWGPNTVLSLTDAGRALTGLEAGFIKRLWDEMVSGWCQRSNSAAPV